MWSRNCTAYFTVCVPCPEVNVIRANNKLITSESSNTARIYASCTYNLSVEHLDISSRRKASKKRTQKNMFAINKIQLAFGRLELTTVLQKDSVSTSQRTRVVSIRKTKCSCCGVALHMKNLTKHIHQMSRQ